MQGNEGRKAIGGNMKAYMKELGHSRTPKDLMFLLSKNTFMWGFALFQISYKV